MVHQSFVRISAGSDRVRGALMDPGIDFSAHLRLINSKSESFHKYV